MLMGIVCQAQVVALAPFFNKTRRTTMRLNALLLAIVLLCFSLDALAAVAGDSCNVKTLNRQPSWISSAQFNAGELLIADPKSRKLLAYNVKTWNQREVQLPPGVYPASLTKVEGGFLVKDGDNAEFIGNDEKVIGGTVNILRTKSGGDTGLGAVYSNWITRGSTFIGYGSVPHINLASGQDDPYRGFSLGFIRGRVSIPSRGFSNVEIMEATDDNGYYLFGLPYFAATEDGLFLVRMRSGGQASIQRVRESGSPVLEDLPAFPEEFRAVPRIKTPSVGPSSVAPRFAEIQRAKIAAGLFGQGDLLYLLTRQPARTGEGTEWLLFQIDPSKSKPLGAVRLPTTAAHLSVVPGPKFWYLIERGEVQGWGSQDIKTVVEVPVNWITLPEQSPINVNALRVSRCGG